MIGVRDIFRIGIGPSSSLFHHLPPSIEPELDRRLAEATRRPRPYSTASGVISLGRGVAIRISAPELETIRAGLADAFQHQLVPQDASGWRPHVTVQNKAEPTEARALYDNLKHNFQPRPVVIAGIASWWYRGGPWELIKSYAFR
jgi:predicted transcriptional regulator